MRIIADSGSTKTDWVAFDFEGNSTAYSTIGLNPFFHTSQSIAKEVSKNVELAQLGLKVEQVFFYGAGCSNERNNLIVKEGLEKIFVKAEVIVQHDFLAAVFATYNGTPSISCILGTGSNSCFFDGENISEIVPALGHIMGDEGSGSYLGKELLKAFLYKQLPQNIHDDFINEYHITKDEILENVLSKPGANIYLASFARFYNSRMNEPFLRSIVVNGFREFIDIHVKCFPNYAEVSCHFIGSIAYYHRAELEEVAKEACIKLGNIVKKPINKLVEYHLNLVVKED